MCCSRASKSFKVSLSWAYIDIFLPNVFENVATRNYRDEGFYIILDSKLRFLNDTPLFFLCSDIFNIMNGYI